MKTNTTLAFSCSLLAPAELVPSREWDIHPFLPDSEPTYQSAASIRDVGILVPPLVKQTAKGKYEFVSGRREYHVLQQEDHGAAVWCRILAHDVPAAAVLQLLFEETSAHNGLSAVELAYFYRLVRIQLTSEADRKTLLTNLGLQTSPHFIDRTLRLLDLKPEIQLQIMRGIIPENIARELLKLKSEDRETAFKLITELNIGGGKQKRLLFLMRDVAGRSGLTFAELIDEERTRKILSHPQMNTPQKSHALLQLLQGRHTPSLDMAEAEFASWKSSLELPEFITIEHSPAFERDDVTILLKFDGRKHVEQCLPDLINLAKKRNFSQG